MRYCRGYDDLITPFIFAGYAAATYAAYAAIAMIHATPYLRRRYDDYDDDCHTPCHYLRYAIAAPRYDCRQMPLRRRLLTAILRYATPPLLMRIEPLLRVVAMPH